MFGISMLPRRSRLPLLLLLVFLACPRAASAQVRPGVVHRLESAASANPLATADPAATRDPASGATHDPDADGALIGAAVGTAGVAAVIYGSCRSGGTCGAGALVFGTLIGGLGGLVVGGLVDAADPLTSPEERRAAARAEVGPPAEAAAPPDSTRIRGRGPVSRRNDLIGAGIGAAAGNLLAAGVCSSISDTGGCPIFHPAYLPVIAVGALLGAGIGSAIGDSADEERE